MVSKPRIIAATIAISLSGSVRAQAPPAKALPADSSIHVAPDLSRLPRAARQAPLFQKYRGGSLRAGESSNDPVTAVRVTKVTDARTPVDNQRAMHHYASGPVQISRAWGTGGQFHTINLTAAGNDYLVDYRRGGTLSRWRRLEVSGPDLSFTFSLQPTTPQIAFVVRDMVLQRFDTRTMSLANTGHFPKDLSAFGKDYLVWLQNDRNDEWFVMMTQESGQVIAWNSVTDQLRIFATKEIDEPHLERDGRYVLVARESDWLVWDLQTDGKEGPHKTPFRGHPGAFRSLFAASEGDSNPATLWRHDPVARTNATIYVGEQSGNGGQHRGDQWILSDREGGGDLGKQWVLQSVHDEGEALPGDWRNSSGEIFSAPVRSWGAAYKKPEIGIRAVRQFAPADKTTMLASLSQAGTVEEMREGTFHFNAEKQTLPVWLFGGGNPTGRVVIRAPALVHDAVALLRLDGSDARLVCHHYSLDAEERYEAMPKATISPDGKLVMFSSNMNDSDGRIDVFAAEVPVQ
jgi:hypothetical protein